MKFKFNGISLVIIFILLNGCTTYREEDYDVADSSLVVDKTESICVNMEPAQEDLCKERKRS